MKPIVLTVALAGLLLGVGCSGHAAFQPLNLSGNANESLSVRLAPAQVQVAIRALQSDTAVNSAGVSVNISPETRANRLSAVQTGEYIAALTDARSKADALAAHLGLRGGVVRSIDEVAPQEGRFGGGALMKSSNVSMVSLPATGVIMLAVTYDFGGTPISVFGMQTGAASNTGTGDVDGLFVNLQAHGSTAEQATSRLREAEDAAKAVVKRFGATDADISVREAGESSF